MAAVAAGASVMRMTGTVDLAARLAAKGEGVVGATSLVMGTSRPSGIWVSFMNVIAAIHQ